MNARNLLWLALLVAGCDYKYAFDTVDDEGFGSLLGPTEPPIILGDLPGGAGAPVVFVARPEVTNRFVPMAAGMEWVYEGSDELSFRRDIVRVLDGKRLIEGVACTPVLQEVFLDGRLAEQTTLWFAQDIDGAVWQFGEESIEFSRGIGVRSADSWEAGVDGNLPWMYLGGDPQPGSIYAGPHSGHADVVLVRALGVVADVPAGVFGDCLEVVESNPDDPEDEDLIIYAPGVGMVSEESNSGRIDLVSFTEG